MWSSHKERGFLKKVKGHLKKLIFIENKRLLSVEVWKLAGTRYVGLSPAVTRPMKFGIIKHNIKLRGTFKI